MSELRSVNPSTGAVVGSVQRTPVEDVARVIDRARAAAPAWVALGVDGRAALLATAEPALRAAAPALARLITLEMGKIARDAVGEVDHVVSVYTSDVHAVVDALAPQRIEDTRLRSTVVRDPLGVAVCITPWNYPVLMPHEQILPALIAGNTVIFKPSEETPLVGQTLAALLQAVLPPDVLQVVHGDGEQGRALVAGDVDLIAFTGSRATGLHIASQAALALKRLVLELGGKDPLIVLPGADLDAAVAFAARNTFGNAGQVCVSTERIFVHEALHDAFVAALVERAKTYTVGDGFAAGVRVGPMVHARQKQLVLDQVAEAQADGARVAWAHAPLAGCFLGPMVLTGVADTMRMARDETFGPVASVSAFASIDEVVQRANATRYALGASVYGPDALAEQVARSLAAGMVGVNQGCGGAAGTPWVGARQSGVGFHSGAEGHRNFAQVRVITWAKT